MKKPVVSVQETIKKMLSEEGLKKADEETKKLESVVRGLRRARTLDPEKLRIPLHH